MKLKKNWNYFMRKESKGSSFAQELKVLLEFRKEK